MIKKEYDAAIQLLKKLIQDCEFKESIYLVGGCVRDIVLGNSPKDIDLCIDYPDGTDLFIEFLKDKSECSGFVTYNRFKTGKFTLDIGNDTKIDIECVVPRIETYNQGPRKPDSVKQTTIEEDAIRRDFCCNALYKNLLTGDILDPTGRGIQDCKDKILRTPIDPEKTYIDDPLRMLRAIRFSCTKKFSIEVETYSKISNYPEYYKLSKERIRDEFTKIIMSKQAVQGIRNLISKNLMDNIIPNFQKYITFDQNSKYHDKTWAEHSFAVLDYVIKMNPQPSLELRLAALLHDVSKPTSYQVRPDGSFSYHRHDKESAILTEEILTDLKYPGGVINKVKFLVENHMCIKQLYDYSTRLYTGKPKKTRQLIRLLGDNLFDQMRLIDADNMSHKPYWNMPGQVESFLSEVRNLKDLQPKLNFSVPVTGKDIMETLKIKSGRLVGDIKKILQEYYDESPGLDKYGLFCRYISEFGPIDSGDDLHTLWVVRNDLYSSDDSYKCYISELKDIDGSVLPVYTEIPLIVTSSELYDSIPKEGEEVIGIPAYLVPLVWRKKQRQINARRLMKEILDEGVIRFWREFPDFKELIIKLDSGPDFSAIVKWNDNTSEEWV